MIMDSSTKVWSDPLSEGDEDVNKFSSTLTQLFHKNALNNNTYPRRRL